VSEAPRALLEVRQLTKTFSVSGRQALKAADRVSFDLRGGEVVALVGQSGSGKSTILRMLAGLEPPSEGEVHYRGKPVLGRDLRATLAFHRSVQIVLQDPFASLNPVHTVAHHLERPLVRHNIVRGRAALTLRQTELLQSVGLEPAVDFLAKKPHELSGGQRQRVAIARALAVQPEIILADEPTSMLDVSVRAGILNLLADLKQSRGLAYLYVTHDLASARYLSDRLLVLRAGQVVESGPTEAVIQQPAHPYTRQLVAAAGFC
jgi:peptide/nickel transport system ATP-binding protein